MREGGEVHRFVYLVDVHACKPVAPPLTNMEGLPRDHVIHFQVCESECVRRS